MMTRLYKIMIGVTIAFGIAVGASSCDDIPPDVGECQDTHDLRCLTGSGGASNTTGTGGLQPCSYTPETCNGADDDCDGQVDNGFPKGIPCATGLPNSYCFQQGQIVCSSNGGTKCSADAKAPLQVEYCGNSIDDNCNGQIDESPCIPLGQCSPHAETCNGADDDCDGQVDNGFPKGTPCASGLPNSYCYEAGVIVCSPDGEIKCSADGRAPLGAEICANGIDDNCDGHVDEPPCISSGGTTSSSSSSSGSTTTSSTGGVTTSSSSSGATSSSSSGGGTTTSSSSGGGGSTVPGDCGSFSSLNVKSGPLPNNNSNTGRAFAVPTVGSAAYAATPVIFAASPGDLHPSVITFYVEDGLNLTAIAPVGSKFRLAYLSPGFDPNMDGWIMDILYVNIWGVDVEADPVVLTDPDLAVQAFPRKSRRYLSTMAYVAGCLWGYGGNFDLPTTPSTFGMPAGTACPDSIPADLFTPYPGDTFPAFISNFSGPIFAVATGDNLTCP